jgi:DnaJ-class molecular chaperone
MNLKTNYYQILDISNTATEKEIKKKYYKLSMINHPDKGGDSKVFSEMTEAYDILCGDKRSEYDKKSKFGNNYDEYFEFFDINIDIDYETEKERLSKFKRNDVLDIYINVDDTFNGSIEYERWVRCKKCSGSGKDLSSKIIIRDNDGNILKTFDGEDGCDYCDGTGKYMGHNCNFCDGNGKVGLNPCKGCNGDRRIYGKQKLTKLKLKKGDNVIESMGNHSKHEAGRVGHLIIKKS